MAIGSPKTKKGMIGNFELRIGPLSKAGLLTSDHSVGAIDSVKLNVQLDTVDLLGGFPQNPIDTAITKAVSSFSATLRELSRRNLNVMLGNGLADYDVASTDVVGFVDTTSALAVGATAITMQSAFAGTLSIGDIVTIYDTNNPTTVSVSRVATFTAKAGATPASLTLDANTPLVAPTGSTNAFAAGSSVKLYKAMTVAGGAITSVPNYFSAQLLRLDRATGRAVGYNFWKCAISSGLDLSASVTEFSSFDLQVKVLIPAAVEYAAGGTMPHLASIIPTYPAFLGFDTSDAATS